MIDFNDLFLHFVLGWAFSLVLLIPVFMVRQVKKFLTSAASSVQSAL